MRIVTPAEIQQVAWEGNLEPLGETYRSTAATPRITLGEPASWSPEEALQSETGKAWSPPAGNRRYALLRLACTLHPQCEDRARYEEARLTAYLRPRSGPGAAVAHDLLPLRVGAERRGKLTASLGPDLKFGSTVDVSVAQLGAEIEYLKVFPVIQAYGLGESNPYWHFAHDRTNPLLGCQYVYLVVAAPQQVDAIRLAIELMATVEARFGPVRLGLPAEARTHVTRTIPLAA